MAKLDHFCAPVLAAVLAAWAGGAPAASPPRPAARPSADANPAIWPKAASPVALSDAKTEAFITELMGRMTLEEKVGQVVQADINSIRPDDLATYPLGSILAGGNSAPGGDERAPAAAWVALARAYREAAARRPGAKIPLLFGVDAVHGHNNVIGATIFPHNVGLGAARDPDLVRRIGEATALEVAATGVDWTFGPTVAVPRDDRWGRSYEGYSEDPRIVAAYAEAVTKGLQGELKPGAPIGPNRIVGSAKHFLADGGTENGRDQGDATISERELIDVHAAGYPPAINAGVLTVMASFSAWNGTKLLANRTILTDVLRGRLGFTGFTVGDWNAHGQVPGCSNESCPIAFNAGLDMFMAPDSWRGLYANTLAQVRSGKIDPARLDEAVRRILRVKVKAGLFDRKRPYEGRLDLLGSPAHRALAREAVRKSLVLLKNDGAVLPIRPGARVLVAGAADDIGQAAGGWTLTWQGTGNRNADFPHGQSIWAGIAEAAGAAGGQAALSPDGSFTEKPDVAVVVFGETPYAEFQGDLETVDFAPEEPLAILKRLKAQGVPVVSVFLSGRPLWTNPEINASDAFVAAWLPGSEGGGVADVLLAGRDGKPRHDFSGRLSFSWPRSAAQTPLNAGQPDYAPQFAYGYGLTYARPAPVGRLSEDPGVALAKTNPDRYLGAAGVAAPWSLVLRDEGGSTRAAGASAASPRDVVTMRPVDAGAQESGRALSFRGGEGAAEITGPPVDLTRQANGDMAIAFRVRVEVTPSAPVYLMVDGGWLDIAPLLRAAPPGVWTRHKIRLNCFAPRGADLRAVEVPFGLATSGRLEAAVAEINLASNEGDASCPQP